MVTSGYYQEVHMSTWNQSLFSVYPPTWMLPTFDKLIYPHIKNIYNFYCKWIHLSIIPIKMILLMESMIFRVKLAKMQLQLQTYSDEVLPAPLSSSSVIFCQTPFIIQNQLLAVNHLPSQWTVAMISYFSWVGTLNREFSFKVC